MRGFEENGILDQLVELMDPRVVMGLGSIFIEPTRALVAVDVNTGGDFSPASGLKANLHLARVLPRQLRLRGLGGQITLDLAPMAKKDRKQFELASWGVMFKQFKKSTKELSSHLQIFIGKLIPESKEVKKIRAEAKAQKKSWFSRLFG